MIAPRCQINVRLLSSRSIEDGVAVVGIRVRSFAGRSTTMATVARGFQTRRPLRRGEETNTCLRTWVKKPDAGTSLTGFTDCDRGSPDYQECFPIFAPGKTVAVSIVLLGDRSYLGEVGAIIMIVSTLA